MSELIFFIKRLNPFFYSLFVFRNVSKVKKNSLRFFFILSKINIIGVIMRNHYLYLMNINMHIYSIPIRVIRLVCYYYKNEFTYIHSGI